MIRSLRRALLGCVLLLAGAELPAQQQTIAYQSDVLPTPIPVTASGATTLAFTSAAVVVYEVTLSGSASFTFTPPSSPSSAGYHRLVLILHPAGFAATLPASSSSLVWAGGSPPALSTSRAAVVSFGFTGTAPIYGGL